MVEVENGVLPKVLTTRVLWMRRAGDQDPWVPELVSYLRTLEGVIGEDITYNILYINIL